jgi:hypothetical protein
MGIEDLRKMISVVKRAQASPGWSDSAWTLESRYGHLNWLCGYADVGFSVKLYEAALEAIRNGDAEGIEPFEFAPEEVS